MEKEEWDNIEKIVDQALQINNDKRDDYIRQQCGEDSELLREVWELLENVDIANRENFLDPSDEKRNNLLKEIESGWEEKQLQVVINREKIGAYEITDIIGRGGMGVVYKARRADGAFDREVAVKVIRYGMETRENIRRFNNERNVLASLHHPHIARLLDGGVTNDGLPYLIMEIVDGIPIDDYCQEIKATLSQKMELYKQVCLAVQFAHSNLVVHRDIKPNNILVTKKGEVKVLDFGIARLVTEDIEKDQFTQTGRFLMTPEYAAPEQFTVTNINTSVDIYSLGILLYELLAGSNPFNFTGKSITEIEHLICHTVPGKPSENPNASDQIPHDLEVICLKALRKDPADRYGTVQELLDDIWRYQKGEVIMARPATLVYRFRKFVSRNRTGASVAIVFVVMLIFFITLLLNQQSTTISERDRAVTEAMKAAQVTNFLVELFEAGDPGVVQGADITIDDLLERGVQKAAEPWQEKSLQANLLSVFGRVYRGLGMYGKSAELLEQSIEIAKLQEPPDWQSIVDSQINLSSVYMQMGNFSKADSISKRTLEISEKELDENNRLKIAAMHNRVSIQSYTVRNAEFADSLYQQLLHKARLDLDVYDETLASILHNAGYIKTLKGEYQKAADYYKEASEGYRIALGQHHPQRLTTLSNLAGAYRQLGDYEMAESITIDVLEARLHVLGENHPDVSASYYSLGRIIFDTDPDRLEEVINYNKKAADILRNHATSHRALPAYLANLAQLYHYAGNNESAILTHQEAAQTCDQIIGNETMICIRLKRSIGEFLLEQELRAVAITYLQEAYEGMHQIAEPGNEDLLNLAELLNSVKISSQ